MTLKNCADQKYMFSHTAVKSRIELNRTEGTIRPHVLEFPVLRSKKNPFMTLCHFIQAEDSGNLFDYSEGWN